MLYLCIYVSQKGDYLPSFPLQATQTGCKANAYIEISSSDNQTEDRYCGAYLAEGANSDGDSQVNGSKSPGVIYGKSKKYTNDSTIQYK